jgi:hypothetical protein
VKRRALKWIMLLLAGAIINVGIAWGCELFSTVAASTGDASHGFGKTHRYMVLRNVDEQGRVVSMSASPTSFEAGWPLRSLSRRFRPGRFEAIPISFGMRDNLGIDDPNAALPLRPLPLGFALNTMLYAAILWTLIAVPFVIRRRIRIKLGQCAACGYSLSETRGGKCPECGCSSTPIHEP